MFSLCAIFVSVVVTSVGGGGESCGLILFCLFVDFGAWSRAGGRTGVGPAAKCLSLFLSKVWDSASMCCGREKEIRKVRW